MPGAAVLGAEKVIFACLSSFEPSHGISSWHYIRFGAESRHIETVDHVFGGHRQPNRTSDGNVQLIDLAAALQVLDLPHPLLADHVELQRPIGRAALLEKEARSP